jgi:transposase
MHATPKYAATAIVAIDLAKDVFELAFADTQHRVVDRQRPSRVKFSRLLENRAPLTVLMEACGSAHYWARRFQRLGHHVILLPPHQVKPYVLRRKTDRTDADGLLEAARCAAIRPVPVKSAEQQGIQGPHRTREHHKAQRTAAIDLARGLLRAAKAAFSKGKELDRTQAWALALAARVGHNKAATAVANKTARRLWAAEHHRTSFDPDHVSARAAPTSR